MMGSRHAAAAFVATSFAWFSQPATADDAAPEASSKAADTAPVATPAPRPSVVALAHLVEADFAGSELEQALVVASPLASDLDAPRGEALSQLVAQQVAGRLGPGFEAAPQSADLASARTLARGRDALVYLSLELVAGKLRVVADAYPVPRTIWARARDPEPGPFAHAFAEAPIDAEIRAHLAPVPLTALEVTRAKNFESDVLAVDCDDADGDGSPEILTVSRHRVSIVRLRGGEVVPIHSTPWSDLSPVHPAPLRQPIGFARIHRNPDPDIEPQSLVFASSTDRARGWVLSANLTPLEAFEGLGIPDGDAMQCAGILQQSVTGPVWPCQDAGRSPIGESVGGRYDAFDSTVLISPAGDATTVWLGREDQELELRDASGAKRRLGSAGAQLAIGDIDQDGALDVVTSLDVMNPLADAVVLHRLTQDGLVEQARLAAGAGVHAIGICPPDTGARAPIVVATADEIWVVR